MMNERPTVEINGESMEVIIVYMTVTDLRARRPIKEAWSNIEEAKTITGRHKKYKFARFGKRKYLNTLK